MPIYEYRCEKCGREFEEWQKITDPAIDKCSACGGKASRLISHSSFVLKGTGWYVTDYARKDGSSSPTPSSAQKSSDSEKKSSGHSKGSSED
jgi:putative FmdB family regulatory protein